MKKEKSFEIILKPISFSPDEDQKRMDEINKILYELFCQYQKSKSVHKNQTQTYLTREESL